MSYGISVINSNGVEVMNTTDTTWNILSYFVVNSSTTYNIPGGSYCSEFKTALYHMVEFPSDQQALLYIPAISQTNYTISFSGGNISTLVVVMGR
jgi:hypothetical protein